MDARTKVIEGLLELAIDYDDINLSGEPDAIMWLGYNEFCRPLLELIRSNPEKYSDFISAYCRCASENEKDTLYEFLESGEWQKQSGALTALEDLLWEDSIPVLKRTEFPDFLKEKVSYLLKRLEEKNHT